MAKILTSKGFRIVRIDPRNKALLAEAERWLDQVAIAFGYERHSKDGFEISDTRWNDDGSIDVHFYLLNENGKKYAIGEGSERRPATKWAPCPVPPPSRLVNFATDASAEGV